MMVYLSPHDFDRGPEKVCLFFPMVRRIRFATGHSLDRQHPLCKVAIATQVDRTHSQKMNCGCYPSPTAASKATLPSVQFVQMSPW